MAGNESNDSISVIADMGDHVSDLSQQSERDKSEALKNVVDAWTRQQDSERDMRKTYATWILIGLAVQAIFLDSAFLMIGFHVLTIDEWTARTFIISVFVECLGLVWFIVRYLFNDHTTSVFDLIKNR